MKTTVRMIVLLLIGMVAFSGCSTIRSMLHGDSDSAAAPAADVQEPSSGEAAVDPAPAVARFKLYDSWASW